MLTESTVFCVLLIGTCPPCPDSQTIFDSSSCICHLGQYLSHTVPSFSFDSSYGTYTNLFCALNVIYCYTHLNFLCVPVQSLPLEERKKTTLSVAIGTSVAAALVSLLIGLFLVRRYKIRESKRLDEESNPFDNERSSKLLTWC